MRFHLGVLWFALAADDKAKDGVIALQLHAGTAMRVDFRNVRLKVLR